MASMLFLQLRKCLAAYFTLTNDQYGDMFNVEQKRMEV
jgi:hypothetical protein